MSQPLFLMHKIQNYKVLPQISNNIFEQHNSVNGPRYDKNNKIIARSVVGKPDILERIKKKIEESKISNSPNMKNSMMFQKMKQSSRNIMKKSQSTNRMNESTNLSREISHNKSSMVHLINKDVINLEHLFQETRMRIKTNEAQQIEKEKQLTLFEKNLQTRQQRVITSFQDREQSWEILNTTLQSKCHTKSKDRLTLLQKTQSHKLRQQIIKDLPPPPKNWYEQLRTKSEMNNFEQVQVNLDSKKLLQKQNELESSLRVCGESKLKREFGQSALITIMDC